MQLLTFANNSAEKGDSPMRNTKELEERFTEVFPSHEEIKKRAYELYLERGEEGHSEENWLTAEEELKKRSAEGIPFLRLG
jgi:hypothetical protein